MDGKRGRSKWNENITERDKSRLKRENKNVVKISERRARKLVWSRAEQVV